MTGAVRGSVAAQFLLAALVMQRVGPHIPRAAHAERSDSSLALEGAERFDSSLAHGGAERFDALLLGPELRLRDGGSAQRPVRYELALPHGLRAAHGELSARVGLERISQMPQ